MVGIEFIDEGNVNRPATGMTMQVLKACVSRRLLIIGASLHGNIIQFIAP